jgi:hypothetical protein
MLFAGGMSDAQGVARRFCSKIIATLGIGTLIAAVPIFTHFHSIGW